MALKLCATFFTALATLSAVAQSGTPALMTPLANPDPRLAAIHSKQSGVTFPGNVAISPDGTLVAWTIRTREGSTLHVNAAINPDVAKERLVTASSETSCSNASPVWSPDSQTLAFTSSCTSKGDAPGQEQIFLWSKATGLSKQLTHVKGLFQQVCLVSRWQHAWLPLSLKMPAAQPVRSPP